MTVNFLLLPRSAVQIVTKKRQLRALILAVAIGTTTASVAAEPDDSRCGALKLTDSYGPFDYRTATTEQKNVVEHYHFTREVETLQRGSTNVAPGADIDYTLRALPNHPRALNAMMNLARRDKTNRPKGTRWTVDCYFNRAIRFAPDDAQVRVLLGTYLLRSGDKTAAVHQLEVAREIGAASGNFHYNLGLAYFQVQEYEKARLQAYKARELGYELDGLKNLLTRAGQWREDARQPDPAKTPGAAVPETPAPKT